MTPNIEIVTYGQTLCPLNYGLNKYGFSIISFREISNTQHRQIAGVHRFYSGIFRHHKQLRIFCSGVKDKVFGLLLKNIAVISLLPIGIEVKGDGVEVFCFGECRADGDALNIALPDTKGDGLITLLL